MGRAAAAVHHKQALGGKAAALHERRHTGAQGLVVQRLELVEQRRNHGGVEHQHQEVKAHPHGPGPQPPQRAGRAHQPHDERSNGQPNDRGQQQAFDQVGGPQARGDFVKAKALFQPKGGVEAERQVDQAANQGKGGQQCQLGPQRVARRPAGALNQSVQGIEPTQQGPAQQHGRAQCQLQHAQLGLGQGVVGRFLVGLQGHGAGKRSRHLGTVLGHMPDLARAQVELGQHAQQQGGAEKQGESRGKVLHPRKFRGSVKISPCPTHKPPPPSLPNPIKTWCGSIAK